MNFLNLKLHQTVLTAQIYFYLEKFELFYIWYENLNFVRNAQKFFNFSAMLTHPVAYAMREISRSENKWARCLQCTLQCMLHRAAFALSISRFARVSSCVKYYTVLDLFIILWFICMNHLTRTMQIISASLFYIFTYCFHCFAKNWTDVIYF